MRHKKLIALSGIGISIVTYASVALVANPQQLGVIVKELGPFGLLGYVMWKRLGEVESTVENRASKIDSLENQVERLASKLD